MHNADEVKRLGVRMAWVLIETRRRSHPNLKVIDQNYGTRESFPMPRSVRFVAAKFEIQASRCARIAADVRRSSGRVLPCLASAMMIEAWASRWAIISRERHAPRLVIFTASPSRYCRTERLAKKSERTAGADEQQTRTFQSIYALVSLHVGDHGVF